MTNYTTGEMAKLCNVSVRTVQYYDTKGILHPTDLTDGGRRIYNEDDLQKLRLICTMKTIGFSLKSINDALESELSGKILTILLDEQVDLLTSEIAEREKQLEMINVIKESIRDKAIIPANTILGIEDTMKKRKKVNSKKTLVIIYIGVGIFSALGFLFMVWLIASSIWWGLSLYLLSGILGPLIVAYHLKESELICPKCSSVFKPPLKRTLFSAGSHKLRWMTCPDCGHTDWCIVRNQKQVKEAKNNG